MGIENISQPETISLFPRLRLRRFSGEFAFALPWYQDEKTVYLVDGASKPYDLERLGRMYRYLDAHGELYWIEYDFGRGLRPVGDVTFSQEDMPIVIGERSLRGQGIGRSVVLALIQRGRALGYSQLYIREIYDWNQASQRLFTSCGFCPFEKTDNGHRYRLTLTQENTLLK